MNTIEAKPLYELPSGNFIFETAEGGKVTIGIRKDGDTAEADYAPGSLLLTDKERNVIVCPIDARAAFNLALAVANLDPKAITKPQTVHILAVALLAMLASDRDLRRGI